MLEWTGHVTTIPVNFHKQIKVPFESSGWAEKGCFIPLGRTQSGQSPKGAPRAHGSFSQSYQASCLSFMKLA